MFHILYIELCKQFSWWQIISTEILMDETCGNSFSITSKNKTLNFHKKSYLCTDCSEYSEGELKWTKIVHQCNTKMSLFVGDLPTSHTSRSPGSTIVSSNTLMLSIVFGTCFGGACRWRNMEWMYNKSVICLCNHCIQNKAISQTGK